MGTRLILDEEIIHAELNPHVVIFANGLEKYGEYSQFLTENGYPSQTFTRAEPSMLSNPRGGTVFFVSFNLNSTDISGLVKLIEQQLRMTCIVFAESEDFQTAAKLSSAKMSQTLQYPYTQKNFLMALQTLVRKRKEAIDKEVRQRNHHERQRTAVAKPDFPEAKLFANDAPETRALETIVQEGPKRSEPFTVLLPGDRTRGFSVIQEHQDSRTFFAIQQNEPRPNERRDSEAVGNGKKKFDEQLLAGAEFEQSEPRHIGKPNAFSTLSEESDDPLKAKREFQKNRVYATLREELWNEYWALLSVVLIGTVVCLYCLYLTLSY